MLNRVILMGNLTRDPEMKSLQNGSTVCRLSVAVDRTYTNRQTGERTKETDFMDCDAWGKTAEVIAKYFRKGSMILIEGELRNHQWTDNNGTKHYGMRIYVTGFSFCGGSQQQGTPPQESPQQPVQGYPQQGYAQQGYAPQGYPQDFGMPIY